MKIRIHPLTVVMFVIVGFTGNLKLYVLAYAVMALHEFAHLMAAFFIGLKSESITFSPFGVHLRLDCKIINSITDEIILYSAGPLVNAVFALVALILKMPDLYKLNTVLFIMNILPILPLDGGMVAVQLLSLRFGKRSAKRLLNAFSVILGIGVLAVACYSVYIGYINISLFIISVLFIGNIFTGREMYDTDFINAISSRKKRSNKINLVILDDNHTVTDALKTFSPYHTTVGVSFDQNGKIAEFITEEKMLMNDICNESVVRG